MPEPSSPKPQAPVQGFAFALPQAQTPSVYTNALTVKLSLIDLGILFGHEAPFFGPPQPGLDLPIQPDVLINMALPTAKVLSLWLSKMIIAYENEFGAIEVATGSLPNDEMIKQMIENMKRIPLTK